MTNEEAIDAVLAFAVAACPELAGHTYDFVPAAKPKGLPDIVAELQSEGVVLEDESFPIARLQQAALRVWRIVLSIMVEATPADTQDPSSVDTAHAAAQSQLRSFGNTLLEGVMADHTLGGRVPLASPYVEIEYTPPYVEYEDGTRGREMTFSISVGALEGFED